MLRRQLSWKFEDATGEVLAHDFRGVPIKTLVISFSSPRQVLSSREGFREVSAVANNFNPPELWDFLHQHSEVYFAEILRDLNFLPEAIALLTTGVDIDDFALKVEEFAEFKVAAFVTAGTKSNALRVGVDKASGIEREGKFERIGTINTILLTNAALTESAMIRAIITITEAKTIALQDRDIRSSSTPNLQATGTGTDHMIIVSGHGPKVSYTGGHCIMGELMARAVTSATEEALIKHEKVGRR